MIHDSEKLSIFHSMNGILKEMSNREANYTLMLTLYLNMLIVETLRITRIKLAEEDDTPLHMSYAKNLLQETSQSIEQIANECGFSSTARFITMFKQHVGETPLVYRKKYINYTEKAVYPQ